MYALWALYMGTKDYYGNRQYTTIILLQATRPEQVPDKMVARAYRYSHIYSLLA